MTAMRNTGSPFRAGILGCGPYSEIVARGYADIDGASVTAVCDPDKSLADDMAERLGAAKPFDNWCTLIDSGTVDGVEILYAADRHREVAEYALQRGVAVSIHRPLASNAEDANAIVNAQRRSGAAAVVADPLFHHGAFRKLKELLDRKQIGEPQHIRIKSNTGTGGLGPGFEPASLKDPPYSPLLFPTWDKAAVAEHLMGGVAEVRAYASEHARLVSFRFAAPVRLGFHEAIHSPDLVIQTFGFAVDESIEVTGTDGLLFLRNPSACMVEAPRVMLRRKDRTTVWDDRVEWDFGNTVAAMCRAFVDAARGNAAPVLPLEQAARAVRINEAAERSAREGGAVRV